MSSAYRFDIPIAESELRSVVREFREEVVPVDENMSETKALNRLGYELFSLLVRPGLDGQPEAERLVIVPDGPLIGIPYAALRISSAPSIGGSGVDASWLVASYSISVSPSAASLVALRSRSKTSNARQAFLGVGNPLFDKIEGGPSATTGVYSDYFDLRGIGDVAAIRTLSELPETEYELETLANLLGPERTLLLLGDGATESAIKGIDLSDFRVVAFATHGLVTGSAIGNSEPALVLTPPENATVLNDGLLTASEIAALNLDAEIVILSACDTAAGGADYDAMGMSGLARAFFLSGTRNVLASNWPVVSDAAVKLTTGMFEEMERHPSSDYAQALRVAMLKMQEVAKDSLERHPMYWAPFVIIGK